MFNMFEDGKYVGLPELIVVILCALSVAVVAVATIGWVIVFDTFGWDTLVPSIVFVALLPSLTVGVLPAIVAKRLYDGNVGLKVGATTAFVAFAFVQYVRWTSSNCMMC